MLPPRTDNYRLSPPSKAGTRGLERDRARPTVCLVTDSLEPSGMGEHMLALAGALRAHCRLSLACPPTPSGRELLERAAGLELGTLGLDFAGQPHAEAVFPAWLQAQAADICHIHAGVGWEGLALGHLAREADTPVVIRTEHLPYVLTGEDRTRHASGIAPVDKLICVSQGALESFVAAGIPAARIAVIRNGIVPRPPARGRDEVRADLGIAASARVVLTVARFTEQKGHRTLLDAAAEIVRAEPAALFLWAGTGPLEAAMRELTERRDLARHIRFLGQCRNVADLMAASDLFVLPSIFEGLPLSLLEAMAAGLAVVATRVCGTAEAVCHNSTGLLVEPRDAPALAAAILDLLRRPERAARLGANGRRRVGRAFGVERMARETLALYQAQLGRAVTDRPRFSDAPLRTPQSVGAR